MKLKVFTLRYDEALGGFDDAPLVRFLEERDAVAVHEHFFVDGARPHWALLISYRDLPRAGRTPPADKQRPDWRSELSDDQRLVYDALRRWRGERAKRDGKPPYLLLTNQQMAVLARDRPSTAAGLLEVNGVGDAKIRDYGQEVLGVLAAAARPADPAAAAATTAATTAAAAATAATTTATGLGDGP